jgi:flagella basal body P-ring formation protein FlgA
VTTASVRLADVAHLEGAAALKLGDVEVATFDARRGDVTLRAGDIRRALADHGVHWGRVTLRGPRTLTVSRHVQAANDADAAEPAPIQAPDGAAMANPVPPIEAEDDRTVRQLVRQWAESQTGVRGQRLRIAYRDAEDPTWSMHEAGRRFELEPDTADALGRVPLTLRIYENNRPVSTERLFVDIAMRQSVAVAAKTLHRGQIITESDLSTSTQWLDSSRTRPVTDPSKIVGQQTARLVRSGQVVEARDVRSPVVVKRGQLITVRALSGGLVVRTVARAKDDGAVGDVIGVRNVRTRDQYHVEVCGPQEAILVVSRSGRSHRRAAGGREPATNAGGDA